MSGRGGKKIENPHRAEPENCLHLEAESDSDHV